MLRNRVREFRLMHGITQEELARRADIATAVVVRLETVPGYEPRMDIAIRLCRYFNVELGRLFFIDVQVQEPAEVASAS
jgi:putative transcriptional regulator